jgi:hypothetical protein
VTDGTACAAERDALAALDRKLQLVNDRVTAVVRRFATGMYLCGGGGLGKSYSVYQQLERLDSDFRPFNSRMTGKGLFLALKKAPDAVHVLEDMERVTSDRDAQGVLRSALWSQGDRERVVTWTTADGDQRFTFSGGVIMLANRPLDDLPELRALASRIPVYHLDVSGAEMAAQMRRIAAEGWSRSGRRLEAEKCREVCEYVIEECRRASCPLDLRMLDNSCLDYLQWEANHSACDWQDLVASRVRQAAAHFRREVTTLSREEKQAQERQLVRDILGEADDAREQVRLWAERTGKRKSAFYERKREVETGEFDV